MFYRPTPSLIGQASPPAERFCGEFLIGQPLYTALADNFSKTGQFGGNGQIGMLLNLQSKVPI